MPKTSDYDYHFPTDLIAHTPASPRDSSRLLVCNREEKSISHKTFRDIVDFLEPNDLLVFNDTKVIPARLFGYKVETGTKIELLLVSEIKDLPLSPLTLGGLRGAKTARSVLSAAETEKDILWQTMAKPGRRLKAGDIINFSDLLIGEVIAKADNGLFSIKFSVSNSSPSPSTPEAGMERGLGGEAEAKRLGEPSVQTFNEILQQIGQLPTPPYIEKIIDNNEQYQTVYASKEGAIAAPTAGLHFTNELLAKINAKGVQTAWVTLHVGLGTFKPVAVENISEHEMHAEWYELPEATVEAIQSAKDKGGRVIAIGTTTTRVLETVYAQRDRGKDELQFVSKGWTNIFITPPYEFKCIDAMLTNFHLPKSTLLMLVAAFAGKEFMDKTYQVAIAQKYRFYSFGDAMLIV